MLTQGFDGLKDLQPIHRSHPQTTAPETVERIKALALEHPAYGCNRIEAMLALEGRRVSAITVQKILNDHDLGSRYDRWLKLEEANAGKAIEIAGERAASIEKLNPRFKERHVESASPGELPCADTFFAGNLRGIGKAYLHAVVDRYSSYARVILSRLPHGDINCQGILVLHKSESCVGDAASAFVFRRGQLVCR